MTTTEVERPEPHEDPVSEPQEVPPRNWTRWDSIALAAVTLIGGLLRFIRLDNPKAIVFDETYYAKDACWFVNVSEKICEVSSEQSNVHPPLGKWLIAIGIRIFGYDSYGWRVSAAVAGTITIALLYLLGRKILRSTLGATIGSALLALDLLHFVQSRISMLDIFVPMFGVAAILFVVYDRDRYRPGPDERSRNGPLDRPWRLAAGACGGAAVTCKWSGIFYLGIAILLTRVWEIAARRADGRGRIVVRVLLQESLSTILWMVILPVGIYILTYLGRLDVAADGTWWQAFWERQKYMFNFHRTLESLHPYQSPPATWLLLKRPVSYWFEHAPNGDPREIFATGSPFVWGASILSLIYVAMRWLTATWRSLKTRGGTGSFRRAEGVIIGGFVLTYGPWLLPLSDRSAVFLFYLLPTIPFMCLAIAYVATEIGNTWEAKAAIGLFAAGTIGLFAFYYPLTANVPIPQKDWDRRIWIFNNCDKPEGTPTTSTITEMVGTKTETRTTVGTSNEGMPPKGWCWI